MKKSKATHNQYTVPAYWFQICLKTVGCASALDFQHICVLWGTVSADVNCSSIRCYVLTQISSLEINKHCCIHPGSQQMFDMIGGCGNLELAGMAPFILNLRDLLNIGKCCSFGYDIRNDCKLEWLIQRQAH